MSKQPPTVMWRCTALPLWARVALYAHAHHGAYLAPGALAHALTAAPAQVSRAIATAKRQGLLTHDSTARALYTLVTA